MAWRQLTDGEYIEADFASDRRLRVRTRGAELPFTLWIAADREGDVVNVLGLDLSNVRQVDPRTGRVSRLAVGFAWIAFDAADLFFDLP